MIYQTDPRLPKAMQKYGCAFVSLAYYREKYMERPWTAEALAAAWEGAIACGLVSGDLNVDGDMDDPGEATVLDWGGLAQYLGCRLQYVGKCHPGAKEAKDAYVVSAWYNPATKFTHFAVGDSRPVLWDPIAPSSITCRDGYLKPAGDDGAGALRVFRRLP